MRKASSSWNVSGVTLLCRLEIRGNCYHWCGIPKCNENAKNPRVSGAKWWHLFDKDKVFKLIVMDNGGKTVIGRDLWHWLFDHVIPRNELCGKPTMFFMWLFHGAWTRTMGIWILRGRKAWSQTFQNLTSATFYEPKQSQIQPIFKRRGNNPYSWMWGYKEWRNLL